jgi:hypothetical protein
VAICLHLRGELDVLVNTIKIVQEIQQLLWPMGP